MNAVACESGCIFIFENMFIFILKLKIMNIFRSDKIEIEYDSREREITVTMYDKYGHYIVLIWKFKLFYISLHYESILYFQRW